MFQPLRHYVHHWLRWLVIQDYPSKSSNRWNKEFHNGKPWKTWLEKVWRHRLEGRGKYIPAVETLSSSPSVHALWAHRKPTFVPGQRKPLGCLDLFSEIPLVTTRPVEVGTETIFMCSVGFEVTRLKPCWELKWSPNVPRTWYGSMLDSPKD